MPRLSKDPRPRSQQIAADLRAQIMSGDLPPRAQLPATAQIMELYGVPSSATVQAALNILKAEGYIEGMVGKGVFVRAVQQETITPADFAWPAVAGQPYQWLVSEHHQHLPGSIKIREVGEVAPPAEVARAFGLSADDRVVRRSQLMFRGDQPTELVDNYYPVSIARGTVLARRPKLNGGSPMVLAAMGLTPARFEDVVSTRPPTSEEFLELELPTEVPVLRTFRVTVTESGQPVEATVMVKAGHRYEIRYRWQASSEPEN